MARTVHHDRWRLLLVLALIAGVLGMHALVMSGHGVCDPTATAGDRSVTPVASAASPSPAPAQEPGRIHHRQSDTMPMPPSGAVHDVLHLCLAVMAAAAAAMVVLGLAVFVVAAMTPPRLRPLGGNTAPARPPPRSAVRLALVCVLRN